METKTVNQYVRIHEPEVKVFRIALTDSEEERLKHSFKVDEPIETGHNLISNRIQIFRNKLKELAEFFGNDFFVDDVSDNDFTAFIHYYVNGLKYKLSLNSIVTYPTTCDTERIIVVDDGHLFVFLTEKDFLNAYQLKKGCDEPLEKDEAQISHDFDFIFDDSKNKGGYNVYLDRLIAIYNLRADCCASEDDIQTISITNENGGGGDFYRISTGSDDPNDNCDYISISSINEIKGILDDFDKRLNLKTKYKF